MASLIALEKLDQSQHVALNVYEKRCRELQLRLVGLQRGVVEQHLAVCIVFEGMDAAGKGGAIKRLTEYLDPRGISVHATGPPDAGELRQHYLRRFWLRLPPKGSIAIFDRSWYGRMLVEPIEHFCTPEEYARAPRQIRDFELTLTEEGMLLLKFWLQVDKDEQLRRFKDREKDPLRVWKLTPQDWHNREHFDEYVDKANFMFAQTHVAHAPWHLVAANDKRHARLLVLETVATALEQALRPGG